MNGLESEAMGSSTVQKPVDDLYRELDDLQQKNAEKKNRDQASTRKKRSNC